MLRSKPPQIQALLLAAALAAGCASPASRAPGTLGAAIESIETTADSARPVFQQVEVGFRNMVHAEIAAWHSLRLTPPSRSIELDTTLHV